MTPALSIIIVHYQAETELLDCLQSIKNSRSGINYEIIVVDNSCSRILKQRLSRFRDVKYLNPASNLGFSAANNLGAAHSRGKYLFFLNPDTLVLPGAIDKLVAVFKKDRNLGIATPQLLDAKQRVYPLQCSDKLTPLAGIIALSFVNRLFPRNFISQKYWLLDRDRTKSRDVAVVPGTALMIRRSLFQQLKGFDRKFFMYFEEADLCTRAGSLGVRISYQPESQVIHLWKRSTHDQNLARQYFRRSRWHYFSKHFGFPASLIVIFWLELTENWQIIILLPLLAWLWIYL